MLYVAYAGGSRHGKIHEYEEDELLQRIHVQCDYETEMIVTHKAIVGTICHEVYDLAELNGALCYVCV